MSDTLPPLPPKVEVSRHIPTGIVIYGYTADQMRSYAAAALAAAVAAERERCAELMERQHTWISSVSASRLIRGDSQVLMTGYVDAPIAPRQRGPECDYPTCSASCGAVERYCHKATVAPPQREREPLTDEQIEAACVEFELWNTPLTVYDRRIARAIERAHGIKEQP